MGTRPAHSCCSGGGTAACRRPRRRHADAVVGTRGAVSGNRSGRLRRRRLGPSQPVGPGRRTAGGHPCRRPRRRGAVSPRTPGHRRGRTGTERVDGDGEHRHLRVSAGCGYNRPAILERRNGHPGRAGGGHPPLGRSSGRSSPSRRGHHRCGRGPVGRSDRRRRCAGALGVDRIRPDLVGPTVDPSRACRRCGGVDRAGTGSRSRRMGARLEAHLPDGRCDPGHRHVTLAGGHRHDRGAVSINRHDGHSGRSRTRRSSGRCAPAAQDTGRLAGRRRVRSRRAGRMDGAGAARGVVHDLGRSGRCDRPGRLAAASQPLLRGCRSNRRGGPAGNLLGAGGGRGAGGDPAHRTGRRKSGHRRCHPRIFLGRRVRGAVDRDRRGGLVADRSRVIEIGPVVATHTTGGPCSGWLPGRDQPADVRGERSGLGHGPDRHRGHRSGRGGGEPVRIGREVPRMVPGRAGCALVADPGPRHTGLGARRAGCAGPWSAWRRSLVGLHRT